MLGHVSQRGRSRAKREGFLSKVRATGKVNLQTAPCHLGAHQMKNFGKSIFHDRKKNSRKNWFASPTPLFRHNQRQIG